MVYENYVPVLGRILSISKGVDCCSQMMSLQTGNGIVNFMVDSETQVIDSRQLRAGMQVAAFYDSSLPVPMIFPPQYRAKMIAVLARNEQVMLNQFDSNLTATDQSLQLNVGPNTVVKTVNGQNFSCNLANRTLLVYYTMTTRSIPPQTTPRKIVVLC
ncbi:MAG: hypothetical protein SO016_00295 [Lachnospiraceae bacterium]|nr:hypothetical protein [Robinsoniella sp.]MDY3765127.1 hypothetical protein [Lachnospiraceae bacterium]